MQVARAAPRLGSFAVIATSLYGVVACGSDATLPRGHLVVALGTDMAVTKDLDELAIQVTKAGGSELPERQIPLLPGEPAPFGKPLPGTLALVPADAGGERVQIRVAGRRLDPVSGEKVTRVVREASVDLPRDRAALLRLPLNWLCEGQVSALSGSRDGVRSACDDDETCVAGACRSAQVELDALPDYEPADVFGGGDEAGTGSRCLDIAACFGGAELREADADCSLHLPDGGSTGRINVALALPASSDGHCLDAENGEPGQCYVPFDADAEEGFTLEGERIVLPRAACERPAVLGFAVSTACATKDPSIPVCGPWTGWPNLSGE